MNTLLNCGIKRKNVKKYIWIVIRNSQEGHTTK